MTDGIISGKMSFKPEEIADGKLIEFINFLIKMNSEIRLWTDGYCYIVEYIEDVNKADGIEFRAVNYDEVVVNENCVDWERVDADGRSYKPLESDND